MVCKEKAYETHEVHSGYRADHFQELGDRAMSIDATVLDDDRRLLRETVRSLVAARVEPNSKAIDETGVVPAEIYESLTDTGLNAPTVPPPS